MLISSWFGLLAKLHLYTTNESAIKMFSNFIPMLRIKKK